MRDGSFTDWTSFGAQGQSSKFTYTTQSGGIFQVKAVYTGGTSSNEFLYVRSHLAAHASDHGGNYNPIYEKGQPDYVGVADTDTQIAVRQQALINLGNTAYGTNATLLVYTGGPTLGTNINKCNIFDYHKASDAGAIVPLTHTSIKHYPYQYPPSAYDWWDVGYSIGGWSMLSSNSYPQPGYVASRPDPNVFIPGNKDYGQRYGHVGILDYDGSWIQAGSRDVNKYPHITMPEYQPNDYRTYIGD